ncbi:MAG: hypothetical protein ACJ790_14480, partial [Myxococcaceae bacterium]
QKVLEADPKDVRVLQKMGELFQKKNDNAQAAQYFIKVAESYSSDGFFLKAVALYKQVLKLNPGLIEVNLKLAELHQQLQLMSEAMAYYQLVANHYDKAGDIKASLDTLKKMVDLDPDNVASRIKLAELYAREKMDKDAALEFKRAAEYLKRNNRTDDYLRVAERLSALQPDDLVLSKELANAYVARQDHKRALAKLQVAFKADPRDIDTLNLLAQAFQGLGQSSKTVSVYKELAKVYSDKGRNDEANKIWTKVEQLDPNDPDVMARKQSSRPAAAAQAPAQPQRQAQQQQQPSQSAQQSSAQPSAAQQAQSAPPPGVAAPSRPAGANPQLAKLLTETDVYVKYGLHDKALEHLRKVFGVDPENLDAHEKAYHIYVAANNQAQAFEQLLNVLRLCTRRADVQRAQPYLATLLQQQPGHPEVSAFLSVLRPGAGGPAPAQEVHAEVPEDAILVDSADEEVIVADAPEDALAGQTVDDLDVQPEEEVVAEPEMIAADEDEQLVTDEPMVTAEDDQAELEPQSGEMVVEEAALADDEAEVVETEEPATNENMVPESVPFDDFEPRTEVGHRPNVEAYQLEQQQHLPPVLDEEPQTGEFQQAEDFSAPQAEEYAPETTDAGAPALVDDEPAAEESVAAPDEADPASEECDEAQFFLDQGLTEEAREIIETVLIAYPGNARGTELMARLEEMEAAGGGGAQAAEEPPAEEVQPPSVEPVAPEEAAAVAAEGGEKDAFDLAAELADELGELGEEAPPEEAAPEASGDDFQISVDQVFSEFKKGLQKVVKPEDVETHYDLGIAYREMGLLDDAIGEFTVSREGCLGKKKEVDCLTMIGTLQKEKGEPLKAVESFKQALGTEHAGGEVQKALLYELGTAHEQAGSLGKALFHFLAVQKLDPKYRDVAAIVTRLSGSTKPEPDPVTPGSAGKPPPNGPNGANGNGHGGGNKPGGSGPKGGTSAVAPEATAAGKSRKVGYV